MYPAYSNPKALQRQQWRQTWPTPVLAIIATLQLILTAVIIGLESWSVGLNFIYSYAAIGYIAAFFYTITWISTFTVVCCSRDSRGCATHALVENIISIIMSLVLIIFDARFIRNPYVCYWPTSACTTFLLNLGFGSISSILSPYTMQAKLNAIKAQLACAVIMLIVGVAFVCIYIYTAIKVRGTMRAISEQPTMELNQPMPPVWSVPAPTPTPAPMWQQYGSQIPPPIPHASVGGFVRN